MNEKPQPGGLNTVNHPTTHGDWNLIRLSHTSGLFPKTTGQAQQMAAENLTRAQFELDQAVDHKLETHKALKLAQQNDASALKALDKKRQELDWARASLAKSYGFEAATEDSE